MSKVLVVLHESRFSGAPLIGVSSASALMGAADVDVASFGSLSQDFSEFCLVQYGILLRPISDINFDHYDYVLCHSAALGSLVARLITSGKRVVWWIHEDLHFFDVCSSKFINFNLLNAHSLVFTSEHCAYRTFSNWVWKRKLQGVYIVKNFVELREKLQGCVRALDSKLFQICHFGVNFDIKGTDRVFQLSFRLESSGKQSRTHVFGRYDKASENHPKFKNIVFHGSVPHYQAMETLSRCHVLLSPSRRDNNPLCILEAIALGVPVISSPLPSYYGKVTKEHGLYEWDFDSYELPIEFVEKVAKTTTRFPSGFSSEDFKRSVVTMFENIESRSN